MANRIRLQLPQHQHDAPWNPDEALAEALAERTEFLSQHPKYLELQKEIDRLMDKAGSQENRMTVLAMLMEGKLIELHDQLKRLNKILVNTGIEPNMKRLLPVHPKLGKYSVN